MSGEATIPDPDWPWVIATDDYAPMHPCPLPALGSDENGRNVRWVKPGLVWTCPDCGLRYVSVRTSHASAMWISSGTGEDVTA